MKIKPPIIGRGGYCLAWTMHYPISLPMISLLRMLTDSASGEWPLALELMILMHNKYAVPMEILYFALISRKFTSKEGWFQKPQCNSSTRRKICYNWVRVPNKSHDFSNFRYVFCPIPNHSSRIPFGQFPCLSPTLVTRPLPFESHFSAPRPATHV